MTPANTRTGLPENFSACALLDLLPPDVACECKKKCCKKFKRGKRCKSCPNS